MSVRHSYTTSDYIEWDTMLNLVRRLYKDGDYRMSLLIGCGCFFGLRISDLLTLNWNMLLDGDSGKGARVRPSRAGGSRPAIIFSV